jgi:hypothetical protein
VEVNSDSHSVVLVPLSLSWVWLPVALIDKLPLLVDLSMEFVHDYVSVLRVLCTLNISNHIGFLVISKEWTSPFELLVPSRVGCSKIELLTRHVERVTSPLLRLDSLRDSVEVELLGNSVLDVMLDYNIVGTNGFHHSLLWEFGSKIEEGVDSETVVSVNSSLLSTSFTSLLVGVSDKPLLILSSMLLPSPYWLTFCIFAVRDIKYLLVPDVLEHELSVLEDLPPSRVSTPELHLLGFS